MPDIWELLRQIRAEKEPAAPVTWIVAGLGNPDRQYIGTRHNVGFAFLDIAAEKYGVRVERERFHALTGEGEIAGVRALLVKPLTYMNDSGVALREAASFYKIPPERVLVVFDDISLPPGRLRVRRSGSDGGHNGVKSILYHLRSDAFPRIKIGVGEKPRPEMDLAAWVLSRFTDEERPLIASAAERATGAAELILSGSIERAMNLYNGK